MRYGNVGRSGRSRLFAKIRANIQLEGGGAKRAKKSSYPDGLELGSETRTVELKAFQRGHKGHAPPSSQSSHTVLGQ